MKNENVNITLDMIIWYEFEDFWTNINEHIKSEEYQNLFKNKEKIFNLPRRAGNLAKDYKE